MNDLENTDDQYSSEDALEPETPLSDGDDIELDIRESLEEIKAREPQGDEDDDESAPDDEEETEEQEPEVEQPAPVAAVPPPHTWTAESKEWFLKQAPEVQKELKRRTDDMERQFHSINQQWAKVKKEHEDIDRALADYEKHWAKAGITRGEGIKAWARAQMMLDADPITAIEKIANTYGTSIKELAQLMEGGTLQTQRQDPILSKLYEKVHTLEQHLTVSQQQAIQQQNAGKLAEMDAIKDERDYLGRYKWPELHDDQFVNSLAPVYAGIQKSYPDLSAGEVLKRAYIAATGKNPDSNAQRTEHATKAKQAMMVARPRVNGSRPTQMADDDDPNESVEDTIRRSRQQLIKGY